MVRRGGRRRQKVVWDTLGQAQALLPLLTLDSTQARDGAFTSLKRWRGNDVTLLRTIAAWTVRIEEAGNQVDSSAMLEICVGLSAFDSAGDVDGFATNTTLAAGTGPLTDADNSRWMLRCCVQIPIGLMQNVRDTDEDLVVPLVAPRAGPHSGYWLHIGHTDPTLAVTTWYCEWDSKVKRTLRGQETEWLQCAMEAQVSVTPAVGDDITVAMDAFSGRVVKTTGGLPEIV